MRLFICYVMALLYVAAGIYHFLHPGFYLRIMPPWLPQPLVLVYISGAFEIFFGVLLFFKKTRHLGAWGIILLLIAVFPANIQMMFNYRAAHNPWLWLTILRLPLQFFLIWWAWLYAKKPTANLQELPS